MSRGGPKAVPEGKGPVFQVKPRNADMMVIIEMFLEFKTGFDEIKQGFDGMEERMNRRLNGLQHEMQQSLLAVGAGAREEKTGEREEDAAVNGGDGDTSLTNKGQSHTPDAQEELVFSSNSEQGNLALSKTGSPRRRQTTERKGGELFW